MHSPMPVRTGYANRALAAWGQRWLPRQAADEDLDPGPLLVDMQRRVNFDALPKAPMVVRFEFQRGQPRLMLLKRGEAAVCTQNPGFPEPLRFRGPLAALVAWWRGDVEFVEAQRMDLTMTARERSRARFHDGSNATSSPTSGRRGKRAAKPAHRVIWRARRSMGRPREACAKNAIRIRRRALDRSPGNGNLSIGRYGRAYPGGHQSAHRSSWPSGVRSGECQDRQGASTRQSGFRTTPVVAEPVELSVSCT